MYNAERGEYGIEMGGKTVVLRPTFEAFQKLRALTGVGEFKLLAMLEDDAMPWGIREIVSIVFVGRFGAGETVTMQQCHEDCVAFGIMALQPICHEFLCRAVMGGKSAQELRAEKKADSPPTE